METYSWPSKICDVLQTDRNAVGPLPWSVYLVSATAVNWRLLSVYDVSNGHPLAIFYGDHHFEARTSTIYVQHTEKPKFSIS